MVRKFGRLLAAILIVSLALYLVVLNKDPATLRLSSETAIQSSLGIISIAIFITGILCTAIVTLLYGFRGYLRERNYRAREREHDYFMAQMVRARSLQASGLPKEARQLWEALVRRYPESLIAKIELARSLREAGQDAEALKALDSARLAAPDNLELLFEAAETHIALGNKTAAIDLLALTLRQQENAKAAIMARDLSEQLERLDDALQYQDTVERLSKSDDTSRERLLFKKLLAQGVSDKDAALDRIRDFVRSHRSFAPALARLAESELEAGRAEEAASLFAQAAGLAKDRALWRKAVQVWSDQKKPERALAAARSACNSARGSELRAAQLDLIELKVDLGMNDEARKDLSELLGNLDRQGERLEGELHSRFQLLKASALAAQANQFEIEQALEELRKTP